jgi:hypothetical protein
MISRIRQPCSGSGRDFRGDGSYRAGMSSYGHHVRKIAEDHYRLSWKIDFKNSGSRLRFPRVYTRDTGKEGAMRFARRWKVAIKGEDGATRA